MKKNFLVLMLTLGLCAMFGAFAFVRAETAPASDAEAVKASDAMAPEPADTDAPDAPGDDENYGYGTVKEITVESDGKTAQLVTSEFDYDGDQNESVTYKITPDTQLENVKAISELAKDDSVEIYFTAKDNDKIATRIIKEVVQEGDVMDEGDLKEEEMAPAPGAAAEEPAANTEAAPAK